METGTRWSGRSNPRDLTLIRQKQLLAEKAKRDAAADVDVDAVIRNTRKRAFDDGFQVGHDVGWASLATSLHNLYRSEGINAVQEFRTELDTPDDGIEAA
jgi:hypothetical protein